MNFQLLKLVIWPKATRYPPRIVEFKPGVLNVITGSSRTGKSAIIPIIDYCLASSDCFIPIDTIRNYASWYGVVVQTDHEEILLARGVPTNNKVSNEFFVLRSSTVSIPPVIDEPNEKTDGVKSILNTISQVPYFSLDGNSEKGFYKAHLGFRDLMALVFQSQDIVANQNILFYKTHAHVHRERLRNWFPFILGAENMEILIARQKLQDVEGRLKRLHREFDKTKAHSSSWMNNMLGQLKVAREYGLLTEAEVDESSPEGLLGAAKRLIEDIPNHAKTRPDDIHTANKGLAEFETEEANLSTEIGLVKKRLTDVARLKSSLAGYGDTVKSRVERLHVSQWLDDISTMSQDCPACGSTEHPRSHSELTMIAEAFRRYEKESKRVEEIPTSFLREEDRLSRELESLLDRQNDQKGRYDILIARDKEAQKEFQRGQNMFLFLGHLKASMEYFESLSDGGKRQKEISTLEEEYSKLSKLVDRDGVQKKINAATKRISQGLLNHLKTLDVEEKYRETEPKFNVKDLNVSVLSTDGNWHYLAEVGSASNWVSFHLALFCSLQEFFAKQEFSSVPNFVIFDQPSQVYFPKVKRGSDDQALDHKYEDEDVQAVEKMFRTVADSIIAKKGAWQGIILDHADSTVYGEIEGVHEVEEWRGGKKLIPEVWIVSDS